MSFAFPCFILYRCSYDLRWFCIMLWICKSFMQECIILWICKPFVQECMFFEVGSFVLYFQVVFILKILSGQSPFDYFFFLFFSVARSIFKLQRSEQQESKLVWPNMVYINIVIFWVF